MAKASGTRDAGFRASFEKLAGPLSAMLVLLGLYWSSHYSYLLFHSLVEAFSIIVSVGIFAFSWNTRRLGENDFLVLLGIACLFVGFIDLLHMLSYKGMGVFQGYDANLPTQLWIADRFLLSTSFLIAPFFIKHKLRYSAAFICYGIIFVSVIYTIFYLGIFPDCFVDGYGLTHFKKDSEYIIAIIFLVSLYNLVKQGSGINGYVLRSIARSIVLMIASDLCFTIYSDVYGFSNMIGHFCKILGFYVLYKGIMETGLTRPLDLLFFDLKRKQQELQESEARYRALFENSHSIMLLINPANGRIVEANPAACSFYGYARDDLLSRNISEINTLSPEDVRVEMERARTGERSHFHFRHRLANGEERDVEVHSGAVGVGGEKLLCSIIHDSTEQRRAEEALKESENKYRTIFETTGTATMIVEEDMTLSLVNAEFVRLFGRPKEEVSGRKSLREFVSAEDRTMVERWHRVRRNRAGAAPGSYEARFVDWEGNCRNVVVTVGLIPGTARSVISLLDITERKRMEEEILKARKLEFIAILAGGIAHDFNNLLGIILGYANLAAMKLPPDHPAVRSLAKVEDATTQARELVEKFMTLAAQWQPVKTSTSVSAIIADAIRAPLPGSDPKIECVLQPDLWLVEVDADQIGRAIRNVVANAGEATSPGGIIHIAAMNAETPEEDTTARSPHSKGRYVRISIRDQGNGIPEKDLGRVFDPYFSTKMRGNIKGMGMGLALAHSIVSRHGGTISVESEEGVGTVVYVYLPAADRYPSAE